MNKRAAEVAVVIPNLDGGEHLLAALASVRGFPGVEIVVADNGSSGAELAVIRSAFPETGVVALGRNRGFAAACDAGIRATTAPFVMLLNNDATLAPGALDSLHDHIRSDERLGAVQALVLDGAGERVDTAGIHWNRRGEAWPLGVGAAPPSPGSAPFPLAGVSATAALYRRAALAGVGDRGRAFHPRYFAYYEDVDLSLRLLRRGWRLACVPAARACHRGSLTGRRWPWRRERLLARNRWWTLRRNLGSSLLLRSAGRLLRADLAHAHRVGLRGLWLLAMVPLWIAGAPRLRADVAGERLAAFPQAEVPPWLREGLT